MFLSDICIPFAFPPEDIQLGKISIPNLVWSSRWENNNIVVLIFVWLFLLQVLLSFLAVNVKAKLLVIVIPDPCLRFYLQVNILYELLRFLYSYIWFFIIRNHPLLLYLFTLQCLALLSRLCFLCVPDLIVFVFITLIFCFHINNLKYQTFLFNFRYSFYVWNINN